MATARSKPATPVKRKDTRDRILRETERLLVSVGYASMSLDDVARAVGIRTPSLYHHFPGGKEELLLEIGMACAVEDSVELTKRLQLETHPFNKLRAAARYFSSLPEDHPHHALAESRRQLSVPGRQQLQSHFAALIEAPLLAIVEAAIAARQIRAAEPIAIVRALLMLMLSVHEFEAEDRLRMQLPDFLLELFEVGVRVQKH